MLPQLNAMLPGKISRKLFAKNSSKQTFITFQVIVLYIRISIITSGVKMSTFCWHTSTNLYTAHANSLIFIFLYILY